MVSKSSAPHSIRFRNDLWARIETEAASRKVTPNEVVVAIVEAGLPAKAVTSRDMPTASSLRAAASYEAVAAEVPAYKAAASRAIDALQIGPIRRKPGELAKKGSKR